MIFAALIAYAGILMISGYTAKKRKSSQEFFDGGRSLSSWTTFILVTALWTSSSIVVEIDTAYSDGISALWFGISVAALSILVALLFPFFQRLGYTSSSALLGKKYGPVIRRVSGLIIGLTFPIFALSNASFAGIYFHELWGWPLWVTLTLITSVLVGYIQWGGLLSLAATQGLNLALMLCAILLVGFISLHSHPVPAGTPLGAAASGAGHLAGLSVILVWFAVNLLNVFSAQAEMQMLASVGSAREARRIVWLSTAVLLAIVGLCTWIGIVVRMHAVAGGGGGLQQLALFILREGKPWQLVIIGVGIWAMALSWCGPLLFSGAMSLGQDLLGAAHGETWTRLALLAEGAAMWGLALWRPGDAAWWRIFGLTVRNAGIVGPTIALLLWGDTLPDLAVLAAMVGGIGTGLALNFLTGFSPTHPAGGINPMWASQAVSFAVLALGRWIHQKSWIPLLGWLTATLLLLSASVESPWIPGSLHGIALLSASGLSFGATWAFTLPDTENAWLSRLVRPHKN